MAVLHADSFDRADTSPGLGGAPFNWSAPLEAGFVNLTGNTARLDPTSDATIKSLVAIPGDDNAYCQAAVTVVGSGVGAGMGLWATKTDGVAYRVVVESAGTPNMELCRIFPSYSPLWQRDCGGWTAGDVMRLAIAGTTLRVYKNGVQVGADQTIPAWAGTLGAGLASSSTFTSGLIDNWELGTLTPAFRATAFTFTATSSGATVPVPAGVVLGDTMFYAIVHDSSLTGTVVPPAGVTQVGGWVVGVADAFSPGPALGLFRSVWNGTAPVIAMNTGSTRGGTITAYAYSGDCTHRQTVTGTNPSSGSVRSSPTISGTSGNTVIAFHGGSAIDATLTFGGGFTERQDTEYYGLNGGADQAAAPGLVATVTPTDTTQSMWILEEIGPTSAPAGESTPVTRTISLV